jgi:serine/threonine-protein kinase
VAPELPRALDAIVLRALERDPDLRFATAREMALALQAAIDPAPPSEVGELVERLAANELAIRGALVADVESRSAHASPAAQAAVHAEEPPAARVSRRRAVTMPLLAGVLIAALLAVFAVRPRSGVAAPESAGSSSSSSSPAPSGMESPAASPSTPPASSGVPTLAPPAPPRVLRPHRSAAPGSKSLCDPPWYLDNAGLKKWRPECR